MKKLLTSLVVVLFLPSLCSAQVSYSVYLTSWWEEAETAVHPDWPVRVEHAIITVSPWSQTSVTSTQGWEQGWAYTVFAGVPATKYWAGVRIPPQQVVDVANNVVPLESEWTWRLYTGGFSYPVIEIPWTTITLGIPGE